MQYNFWFGDLPDVVRLGNRKRKLEPGMQKSILKLRKTNLTWVWERNSLTWAAQVCAAPKGRLFNSRRFAVWGVRMFHIPVYHWILWPWSRVSLYSGLKLAGEIGIIWSEDGKGFTKYAVRPPPPPPPKKNEWRVLLPPSQDYFFALHFFSFIGNQQSLLRLSVLIFFRNLRLKMFLFCS